MPDVLIVIDEAYVEYIRDGLLPDELRAGPGPSQCDCFANLFKAYGLAGMRVGYAVGDPGGDHRTGQGLRAVHRKHPRSGRGDASTQAAGELLARTDAVVAERRRVSAELACLGYRFPASQANFVWLPLGEHTAGFAAAAAQAGVLVRPYGSDGARVTIGAPEENDAFLRFAHAPGSARAVGATDWARRSLYAHEQCV